MLIGRVIVIITRILTYNEKGLFYNTYQRYFNRGILLASFAREMGPSYNVNAHIKKE